jgi:hypothetical protein
MGELNPECCQCLVQGVNHTQQRSSGFPQNLKHASQTKFEVGRGNNHARAACRIRHAGLLLCQLADQLAGEGKCSNRREVHNTHACVGCDPILSNRPVKFGDGFIAQLPVKMEEQDSVRRIEFNP